MTGMAWVSWLLAGSVGMVSCSRALPSDAGPQSSDSGPKAVLQAFLDRSRLRVVLTNVGHTTLVVDSDLVVLLRVRVLDAHGMEVRFDETGGSADPGLDIKGRFVAIEPGEEVERAIDLRDGFKVFRYGVGAALAAGGASVQSTSAYEALLRLPTGAVPGAVEVSYGAGYGFPEAFRSYTGLMADKIGLYVGPLRVVAKTVSEPKGPQSPTEGPS